MKELPPGWTRTTLGQLGRYINGRAFKKSEWSASGRPIVRIQNLTGSSSVFNYYNGALEERHIARSGDLLVSWAATLGAYIWPGPEAAVNQHIFKVESVIDVRFHKYLIDHALDQLSSHTHGSGIVHITRGRFNSVPVLLPPLDGQHRIVAVLEDHLSRVDAARDYLESATRRATALEAGRAVTLLLGDADISSARRTVVADLGELPALPANWKWSRLGQLCDVVGGVTKDAANQHGSDLVEVPYLRVANVQRGRLDLSTVKRLRVLPNKLAALRLEPGDVLLNEGGDRDKLGRGWVWQGQIDDCIHQNHVFRARVRDATIRPRLLSWWANTVGGEWCERHGRQSVNLASISLRRIRDMPVPVPPYDDQDELEEAVNELSLSARRLTTAAAAASSHSEQLRKRLLDAAFSDGF